MILSHRISDVKGNSLRKGSNVLFKLAFVGKDPILARLLMVEISNSRLAVDSNSYVWMVLTCSNLC